MEKSLLANVDDSFFAIPNVLFSASFPVVPVMNPTERPCFIRKGEAVGIITDPANFLDTPKSQEERSKMEVHASCLASMIHSMMEQDEAAKAEAMRSESATNKEVPSDEPLRKKTEINETAALLAGNSDEESADKDSWAPKRQRCSIPESTRQKI